MATDVCITTQPFSKYFPSGSPTSGKNLCFYGVTAAEKSYFLSDCCNEACILNYRCKFIDYCERLDELIALNNKPDLSHYQKRLKYYTRIQLLFIDDFAIRRYSEERIKILCHLVKKRDDFGTSTLFSCQHSPDEWWKQLSYEGRMLWQIRLHPQMTYCRIYGSYRMRTKQQIKEGD